MTVQESEEDATELVADLDEDIYIAIECDLLVIGDSIMTDRHHQSGNNYESDDPQNQIGGIIPSFSLSGWLRHGMEAVVQECGGTACHPGESSANFKRGEIYDRDLADGYHEKGSCLPGEEADSVEGCVILDLFGGFERMPGKFMRRPIQFSPLRPSADDYLNGRAEGHYRQLNRNVVSRNEEDARTPLRATEYDAVANLEGTWHLKFREHKPEFLGLLAEAVELLTKRNTDFMHQLGGARNFGGGIVEAQLVNPLYEDKEIARLFDRAKGKTMEKRKTAAMSEKDEQWQSQYRPAFTHQLRDRVNRE